MDDNQKASFVEPWSWRSIPSWMVLPLLVPIAVALALAGYVVLVAAS